MVPWRATEMVGHAGKKTCGITFRKGRNHQGFLRDETIFSGAQEPSAGTQVRLLACSDPDADRLVEKNCAAPS